MGSSEVKAKMTRISTYLCLIIGLLVPITLAQFGNFGSCQISLCRTRFSRAEYCCRTGENRGCCSYTGGNGINNGGNWGNGINNGGSWGNGNYNNKPGQCPSYNGRKKRSAEQTPRQGRSSGRTFGNNGGWNNGWNGGQGFNPGYNNNNGRCIRDSEFPGSLKCCYLYRGYQCTQPQYFG